MLTFEIENLLNMEKELKKGFIMTFDKKQLKFLPDALGGEYRVITPKGFISYGIALLNDAIQELHTL